MVEQVEMPASSLSVLDPRDAQRKRTEPTPSGCSLTLTQYGMQIPPKEKRQKSCFLWSKTRPSLEESARSKALREWNWPCQSLLRGWPGFLVHFSPQSPGPKTFLSYSVRVCHQSGGDTTVLPVRPGQVGEWRHLSLHVRLQLETTVWLRWATPGRGLSPSLLKRTSFAHLVFLLVFLPHRARSLPVVVAAGEPHSGEQEDFFICIFQIIYFKIFIHVCFVVECTPCRVPPFSPLPSLSSPLYGPGQLVSLPFPILYTCILLCNFYKI